MADKVLYITNNTPLDTNNVPAVICNNIDTLNAHIENCHKTDTAVFIENDISAIDNADGIYFSESIKLKDFKQIRKSNPDLQMIVKCETRHDGILYAEAGADLIVFTGDDDEVGEIVSWWIGIIEIPVAVIGENSASKSADFIILATNT
ncbi:MAG: hypothetical protein ACPG8V_03480 [Alphaproteobacteria bacterium]